MVVVVEFGLELEFVAVKVWWLMILRVGGIEKAFKVELGMDSVEEEDEMDEIEVSDENRLDWEEEAELPIGGVKPDEIDEVIWFVEVNVINSLTS